MSGPAPTPDAVLPRVLLVDDDPTLRQLVALVLEGLAIELIACASVAQARAVLRQAPVRLVITDLMMPGESGEVLLAELAADPALRAGAQRVVFSAGLDAEARSRLQGLGVERLLTKPSGVQAIEDCVRAALDSPVPAPIGTGPAAAAEGPALCPSEHAAVNRHFAGQTALFLAYRQSCLALFDDDLRGGDAAVQAHDAGALRRLAHNLKSVLQLLGETGAAQAAEALEAAAQAVDWPAVEAPWTEVRTACRRLQAFAPDPP